MSRKGSHTTATYCDWNLIHQILGDLVGKKEYQIALLITVGIYTGLRISDMVKLTWEDLLGKDKLILEEQKTGKRREIILHKFLKRMVADAYYEIQPYKDWHLIFRQVMKPMKPMKPFTIGQKLNRAFEGYNYSGNVCTHMLRKTFGRRIWEKNDQSDTALIMLSELFNQSNTLTTRRYLGIRQEELGNLYEML